MRISFALVLLPLVGCGAISFDVDQAIPQQTVPGNALGGILPSFLPTSIPLTIDIKSETQKRDTGPASSANLKSIRFSATDTPAGTFDFLDEVHIFVAAPANSALPRREIATLKPVPKNQTVIDLMVISGIDLLPYINAGAEISAQASGHQPTTDFHYDGHVTVTVHI